MSGWFSVKRGITQHPIFKGHPERLAIWLWLLDNAVWQDTPHDIKGKTVMVKRGSVCASERRIAEEVGVGRQVVRTFLSRLTDERMINPDATQGRSIITICNYEKYQSFQPKDNPAANPTLTQDQPTNKQGNNTSVSKDTGADAPVDPVKVIFDSGVKILAAAKVKEVQARALIGKWRKAHGDEALIAALGRAQREGAIDPVSFIEGSLRFQRQQAMNRPPEIGDERIRKDGTVIRYAGAIDQWVPVLQ